MTIWANSVERWSAPASWSDRRDAGRRDQYAEGLRYLTRLLRVGLDLAVEFGDPRRPELVPAQAKRSATRGTTPIASICTRWSTAIPATACTGREAGPRSWRSGSTPGASSSTSRLVDALREDELVVAADG